MTNPSTLAIEIDVNGRTVKATTAVLREALERLGYDPKRRDIAVAINGEVVPRSDWDHPLLRDGDRVELVGAVQGG
jgi:sulfur carrier protein